MKYLMIMFLCSLSLSQADSLVSDSGVISWRQADSVSEDYFLRHSPALRISVNERAEALTYLNALRTGSGLIAYTANINLNTATQNHIDYLINNNVFGHYETEGQPYYTGVTPSARGTAAGYSWRSYGENISAGQVNIIESIDGLITAIYHRFGFLDFNNNEVGIGSDQSASYGYNTAYGFNMGNRANTLTTQQLNPAYVVWPSQNYTNAQTSFGNTESPDPTPECDPGGITGNPLSVEFNPSKNSTVSLTSFKLYRDNGSEITNTKTLTQQSDPNGHLSATQFVLFPMRSLDIDSRYRAEFKYTESSVAKVIAWNFNTSRYDEKRYEVSDGGSYDVISGQNYIFQMKPTECNTAFNGYSWSGGAIIERLSSDTFRISTTRNSLIDFKNGFEFNLQIASEDSAIAPSTPSNELSNGSLVPITTFLLL